MTEFILFKHPKIKIRKEDFGGIVKTEIGLYFIDKDAYNLVQFIEGKKTYSELIKKQGFKEIIDELLKKRIILKIEKGKAEKIIKSLKIQ